jgi:hypothetical protein
MKNIFLFSVAMVSISTMVCASPATPPGSRGVDWYQFTTVVGEEPVVINAFNQTKNAQDGNESTVKIFANNEEKSSKTCDAARCENESILERAGRYRILVKCSNEKADAESCGASVHREIIVNPE